MSKNTGQEYRHRTAPAHHGALSTALPPAFSNPLSDTRRSAGFTLLEILIALSLTAMLLTMLTAGVYGVIRDWDNNAAGLEKTLEQTVVTLQLERALQGAFPHSYRDRDTLGRHVYFEGERDQLSWVSSVSPQRNQGLTAWRLYSEAGEGIYLQLAPAFSDHPGERLDAAQPILLLEGYALEIQYMFEDLEFQRRWREEWSGMELQSLPMAVHIRLTAIDRSVRNRAEDQSAPIDIIAPIHSTQHRSIQPTQELLN
ncbi:MAG: prepilin-type N-terminal cleavage/methylation domain-containing protein [Pseudohongiella sp.]|nr:prepilin-type N-terminal cleavage/methylation domain-containing protein [Pseudohongiella sp.]